MRLTVGDIIEGKYRIGRIIGEGGMGAVYEGENIRIQRRVAIKVLHSAFTENREVVQRFEREAQAAGRIGNDHILEVLDLGTLADGDLFLVMEFLDGEPLSKRIANVGRLTPEQAIPIIRQVLVGLRAAHSAGIVHRDLKPDNVFILREKASRPDFVKIIDFGISKFQPTGGEMRMTKTGAMMGTPYYMSPEQATGSAEVDARSDLYAVGVILYEAVTGAVPFDAPSFNQLLFKIALEAPRPPQELAPYLDPSFCGIISRAMARNAGQRFQTADEFAAALDAWAAGSRALPTNSYPGTFAQRTVALPLTTPVHSPSNAGIPFSPVHPTPSLGAGRPLGLTPAEPARTGGSWSTTGAPATKSRAPLWISVGAGIAFIVLAVGALTAVHVLRAPATVSPSAAAESAISAAAPAISASSLPVAAAPNSAPPTAPSIPLVSAASAGPSAPQAVPAAARLPLHPGAPPPPPLAAAPAPKSAAATPPAGAPPPVTAAPAAPPAPPPAAATPAAAAPVGKSAPDFGY